MELTVECKKRAPNSKPNALRREGLIPAALYGHNGAESVAITVDAKTAQTVVKDATINNTLIQLNIPDLRWKGKTLLREVQTHPWKGHLYHLSFFSVAAQASLEVTAPLNFVGEAPGVKQEGGALDTVLTELQVECAPDRIPEVIDVDVSHLNLGDAIQVNQLVLPEGVTAIGEPDRVVVSVLAPLVAGEELEEVSPEVAEAREAMNTEGTKASKSGGQ
jgi:large subunit ribosomal protein L25